MTFFFKKNNGFDGILSYLTKQTNGNVQTNGTVEIKCSFLCCGSLESLVNYDDPSQRIHIRGKPSPYWIQIDFKGRKVQINSYMIRSNDDGGRFLKSWAVEISEDGSSWEKVDEQINNYDLKGNQKTKLFTLSGDMTKPFRFIRIISNKENHYNNNGFSLGNLELYGKIIE